MRVALLTNNRMPPREGIARHVLEVAKRLPARGIEPVVLARAARRFGGWEETSLEGVRIRSFPWWPMQPFHQLLIGARLQGWLATGADGVDLLHVHLPLLPPLDTELPRIVTFHSPLLTDAAAITEAGLRARLVRLHAQRLGVRLEAGWLDRADFVTAVSANVRDELATHYRLGGRPVRIVRNGVDAAFFGAVQRRPEPLVLYVGRLGYRKGLERLLEAFATVPREFAERLVLAGEGPLCEALKARAVELGIARRIEFTGFLERPALRELLGRAAVLVNPADYESGPLTVLEAMAAGTPVVSTPTGLVAELGADPPVRVARPTVADLASKLVVVLSDPDEAARRAALARQLVRRCHDWQLTADGYAALYGREERRVA